MIPCPVYFYTIWDWDTKHFLSKIISLLPMITMLPSHQPVQMLVDVFVSKIVLNEGYGLFVRRKCLSPESNGK